MCKAYWRNHNATKTATHTCLDDFTLNQICATIRYDLQIDIFACFPTLCPLKHDTHSYFSKQFQALLRVSSAYNSELHRSIIVKKSVVDPSHDLALHLLDEKKCLSSKNQRCNGHAPCLKTWWGYIKVVNAMGLQNAKGLITNKGNSFFKRLSSTQHYRWEILTF